MDGKNLIGELSEAFGEIRFKDSKIGLEQNFSPTLAEVCGSNGEYFTDDDPTAQWLVKEVRYILKECPYRTEKRVSFQEYNKMGRPKKIILKNNRIEPLEN